MREKAGDFYFPPTPFPQSPGWGRGLGEPWRLKQKKEEAQLLLNLFLQVGVTGLEPATTRPPDSELRFCNPKAYNTFLVSLVSRLMIQVTVPAPKQVGII